MSRILFDAQLVGVQSKVDRTCKVSLNTQELGEDAGKLMNISGEQVRVLMVTADKKIKPQDIPDAPEPVEDEEFGSKPPSQRLRAVLYRLWEQKGKPGDNFELYYRVRMEKIIDSYKAKLV